MAGYGDKRVSSLDRDPLCSGQLWRLDGRGVAQPIRSVAPIIHGV